MAGRPVTGRPKRSGLGFNDLAAAQAGSADAHVLGCRAHFGVHRAQVDVPAPLAHVVSVTNGIPKLRPLAADITNSCHKSKVSFQAVAERLIL